MAAGPRPDLERPGERVDDQPGHSAAAVPGLQVRQQHGELVAADARHGVRFAHALGDALAHRLEQVVAQLVPVECR